MIIPCCWLKAFLHWQFSSERGTVSIKNWSCESGHVDPGAHWGTEPQTTLRKWSEFGCTRTVARFMWKQHRFHTCAGSKVTCTYVLADYDKTIKHIYGMIVLLIYLGYEPAW